MHNTVHVPEGKIFRFLKRQAWLPIPLLLAAIAGLWAADFPGNYPAPHLLLALNFVFSTLISLFIACLIARTFLVRGTFGLLLLGCGVLVWGTAGMVGATAGLVGEIVQNQVNINVTIFNLCALLSALCHLAGVLFSLRPVRPIRASGLVLAITYAVVLGAVGLVTIAAYDQWIPTFFVQGYGGTPLRQAVLGTTIAMFTLTAILLWSENRRSFSPYAYWYALALALIATGLFGVLIGDSFNAVLNWMGRAVQYLGGVYMLIAAFATIRETHEWEIPLGIALAEAKQQYELLFQASSDGIVMHELLDGTPPDRFLQVNDAMCRLLGYTAEELRGLTPLEIQAPEEISLLRDVYQELQANGLLVHERTLLAKDGRRIPTEISSRLFEHQGRRMVISIIRDITERKRAEEALQQSEERLRLLGNNLPNSVVYQCYRGDDGIVRFLYVSAGIEHLNGVKAEDVLRDAGVLYRQMLPGYAERLADAESCSARDLSDFDMDVPMRRLDGQVRWMHLHSRPRRMAGGQVVWDGVQTDVTERKLAEEASRRQNAALEGINRILGAALTSQTEEALGAVCLEVAEQLTQSQFGFIGELNADGLEDIAISNPGWDACRILDPHGHRRPPGNFRLHGLYGHVLASGRSLLTNDPAGHPDSIGLPPGHPPLESFLGVPLTYEGRTIGLVAVGNREGGFSLTDQEQLETLAPVIVAAFMRKRIEAALREANERLTYHMDYSPLAVIEWGADMRLTRWSGEAERIFGWKAEEVLGKRMEDFKWIYEDDQPQVDEVSLDLCNGSNPRRFSENRNYHKDGSVVECEWYNSSLLDESGQMRSILSLVLDVTARKQAEAALHKANAALAESDRRKDEFLAMLAHELRNPLAPVRNAVNVLRLAGDREDLRKRQQDIIDRQVTHMARLLDDLLDVSRVTRGKIELRRQPLDLTDVMAHAVEVVTPLVLDRRHTLHFDPPRAPLRVHADLDRLAQSVGNLLINAAKYTDEGGQIWLSAERQGDLAMIRVRDTGVGIAPELLPRVFDLFIQADRTIDRSLGGLGIGLTLVQKLVQMHGGTVEAHSAGLGQGSEFIIRLPALSGEADENPLFSHLSEPLFLANTSRRVMVVDDIADAAVSLGELLEIWGHEVRTAPNGYAALDMLGDFMPDVVLMDIGMPGMTGFELARRMRQQESGRKLQLVALTGYGQTQDREETRAAGFDDHLVKPVDLESLRKLLAGQASPS